MRRTLLWSRTMVSGCATRVVPVITTCTRNTVTPLWMVLLSRCTMRWLLATGSGSLASRSSKQLQSLTSFARGKAPSSSTAMKSSSPWFSGKLGPQPGSWRLHIRHPSRTCSCKARLLLGYRERHAKFCHDSIWLLWFLGCFVIVCCEPEGEC